jgi:aspartate carbamoyltransferase catalytic subunit
VHSLLQALSHFKVKFIFVACPELRMPQEFIDFCHEHNIDFEEHQDFSKEVIEATDILYMTRVQRERFADLAEYERVKDLYSLHNAMLATSKPTLRVLHPLPRVNEISQDGTRGPSDRRHRQHRPNLLRARRL